MSRAVGLSHRLDRVVDDHEIRTAPGDGTSDTYAEILSAGIGSPMRRRAITRPAEAGGEDHTEMSSEVFARARKAGEFFAHWSAHGLDYGLPVALTEQLAGGRHVIANGSRATIADIAGRVENFVVIEVTARN